jgi:hypothetical protein
MTHFLFLFIDAWIFTNGFDVGIVQFVGKAIQKSTLINVKQKITAVSISKWGSVKNLQQLKASQKQYKQVSLILFTIDSTISMKTTEKCLKLHCHVCGSSEKKDVISIL